MSRYVFQRTGGPLVQWGPGAPPRQARAADAKSLGDWAPTRPGAPEMIGCVPCSAMGGIDGAMAAWRSYAPIAVIPVAAAAGYMGSGVAAAVVGGVAATVLRPWAAGAVVGYMVKGGVKGVLLGTAAGLIWSALTS